MKDRESQPQKESHAILEQSVVASVPEVAGKLKEEKEQKQQQIWHITQAIQELVNNEQSAFPVSSSYKTSSDEKYIYVDQHSEALPRTRKLAKYYLTHPLDFLRATLLTAAHGATVAGNYVLSIEGLAQQNSDDVMEFLNGEDCRELANKYTFVERTKELGYNQALTQTRINPRQQSKEAIDEALAEFGDKDTLIFCKQTGVGRGNGIKVIPVGKFPEIAKEGKPVIVQNKVNVARAFRAVLVDNSSQNTVLEHYFENRLPIVTGDGTSSMRELLQSNTEIPKSSKRRLLKHTSVSMNDIPEETEHVRLGYVGHSSHGGYYSTPDEQTRQSLRQFASHLKGDLEKSYGHKLPVFCVDFATIDDKILQEHFNLEEAKKRFVAFEFQIPFDPGFDRLGTYPRFIAMLPTVRYKEEKNLNYK